MLRKHICDSKTLTARINGRHHYRKSALLLAVALPALVSAQSFQDVGPNYADGKDDSWSASATGLIYKLAGDANILYAVSLNAGVWKRHINGQWVQLTSSSRLTSSLEVDPASPRHLVSGDRDNDQSEADSSRFDLSIGGVWESFDAGDSWQWAFSPAAGMENPSAPAACKTAQSQAIPAILITPSGTIMAATGCGIVRKTSAGGIFNWSKTPSDLGRVTALSLSRVGPATFLWGLGVHLSTKLTALLSSTDDGATWSFQDIPADIAAGVPADFGGSGDIFSLASFGKSALMVFKHVPTTGDDNRSWLLYFDSTTGKFSTQIPANANDGTGLGGRRSFRTTAVAPPFEVGNGLRIVFNAGQNVLEGIGIDGAGQIKWKHVLNTYCAGCSNTQHVHADLWDMLPTKNAKELFVSGDGGIYSKEGSKLKSYNDGLHTQHIHTLAVLDSSSSALGPRIAYSTSDNDAWFWDGSSPSNPSLRWKSYKSIGDVNWTDGDRANQELALEVLNGTFAEITSFGHKPPTLTQQVGGARIWLGCSKTIDPNTGKQACGGAGVKPRNYFVIQSPPSASPSSQVNADLDVVWLTTPPLQFMQGSAVVDLKKGTLADEVAGLTTPILLRNFALAVQPSINHSRFKGWVLESGNVPPGATRVWASTPPSTSGLATFSLVYYVCTCDGSANGPFPQIFKRENGSTVWTKLAISAATGTGLKSFDVLKPVDDSDDKARLEIGGPLFVDPLDPNRLLLLTTDGVLQSDDGGNSWTRDAVLTALSTNSGQDPFAIGFPSGNTNNVAQGTRGLAYMFISAVDFGRGTGEVAVASPFTGVFYKASPERPWLDATPLLPGPLPTVSSIALSNHEVFVGLEGRSLVKTVGLPLSRMAAWFQFPPVVLGRRTPPPPVRLMGANGMPIGSVQVKVTLIKLDGSVVIQPIMTDATGGLALPTDAGTLTRVVFSFAGTSQFAPATTGFRN
jgi:hypothetical protein